MARPAVTGLSLPVPASSLDPEGTYPAPTFEGRFSVTIKNLVRRIKTARSHSRLSLFDVYSTKSGANRKIGRVGGRWSGAKKTQGHGWEIIGIRAAPRLRTWESSERPLPNSPREVWDTDAPSRHAPRLFSRWIANRFLQSQRPTALSVPNIRRNGKMSGFV